MCVQKPLTVVCASCGACHAHEHLTQQRLRYDDVMLPATLGGRKRITRGILARCHTGVTPVLTLATSQVTCVNLAGRPVRDDSAISLSEVKLYTYCLPTTCTSFLCCACHGGQDIDYTQATPGQQFNLMVACITLSVLYVKPVCG